MKKFSLKLRSAFTKYLMEGLTPHKLSLTLALGVTLGIFPMLGPVTLMCFIAAFLLKLNQAALQFVNYIVYPIQILCLIPFYQLGAWIFQDYDFTLDLHTIKEKFSASLPKAMVELWTFTWHALVAWLVIAPFLILILYWVSLPIIKRTNLKIQA